MSIRGPIHVGDRMIWEPNSNYARAVIEITQIKPPNSDDEVWIESRCLLPTPWLDNPGVQDELCWNDEDRTRQACARGVNAQQRIRTLQHELEIAHPITEQPTLQARIDWWQHAAVLLRETQRQRRQAA
jgi:hypothetical protein